MCREDQPFWTTILGPWLNFQDQYQKNRFQYLILLINFIIASDHQIDNDKMVTLINHLVAKSPNPNLYQLFDLALNLSREYRPLSDYVLQEVSSASLNYLEPGHFWQFRHLQYLVHPDSRYRYKPEENLEVRVLS